MTGRSLQMSLEGASIDATPVAFLESIGEIFAAFLTQDSGNLCYGVRISGERFFVKTAGDPDDTRPYLNHQERVGLLRNAVEVARSCDHEALIPLRHVIEESPHGPLLVYDWVDGELVGVDRHERELPSSPYFRFRALPAEEIAAALGVLFDLHRQLAKGGWIACDLYDGCLLYDFQAKRLRVIDLDTYHRGPFTNTMGEMFGSSRFMAPEEHVLSAGIDERTTVFTLGRFAAVFLSDGSLEHAPFRGTPAQFTATEKACRNDRRERWESVDAFCSAWFGM